MYVQMVVTTIYSDDESFIASSTRAYSIYTYLFLIT